MGDHGLENINSGHPNFRVSMKWQFHEIFIETAQRQLKPKHFKCIGGDTKHRVSLPREILGISEDARPFDWQNRGLLIDFKSFSPGKWDFRFSFIC